MILDHYLPPTFEVVPCLIFRPFQTVFNYTSTTFFHQLIASKGEIDVIYVDFSKVFDSVPHNEMLMKLWNIGIVGALWKWFKSYLSNRAQCVSINNSLQGQIWKF